MVRVSPRAALLIAAVVGLGLLSLALFGVLMGLGVKGILVAQDLNVCDRSNATAECVPELSLSASIVLDNSTQPVSTVVEEPYELEWVNWLAGSTGAAVCWAVAATFTLWALAEALHYVQKEDLRKIQSKKQTGGEGGEELGGGAKGKEDRGREEEAALQVKGGEDETDHAELKVDYIGAYRVKEWHGKPLRHLRWAGIITQFCSLLSFIMALVCLLWAVAIGYFHTNRVDKDISAFAIVEFLVGIMLPVFLLVGAILLAIVLDYVTIGRIDSRKRIHRFLPSVKYEEGRDNDYWVIEDRFYFKLDKRDEHLQHGFCYSCDKKLSTWLLTGIVALSLLLCFSYFVDITVVEEDTLSSCPTDLGEYDCFNRSSFNFVDCANETQRKNVDLLHCFRFLRFAVDTSLISSLAQTFAFYLATVALFGHVFSSVKTLLHLHRTRMWGVGFVVVGALAFIVAVVFLFIEDRFEIQVNVLSILQVIMACLFVVLVGVLLLKGDWYEKIFDHKKVKPLAELLLHYDSITTPQLHEIEHTYAANIKKEDPTSKHVLELPGTRTSEL